MASKAQKPLLTDAMAFIRGANEIPPDRAPIGDKADAIAPKEVPAAPAAEVPPAPKLPAPGAAPVTARQEKQKKPRQETKPAMPWDEANPKVIQFVQVRMPQTLNLKLEWIVDNTVGKSSKHALMLDAIEKMADERIAELQAKSRGGR